MVKTLPRSPHVFVVSATALALMLCVGCTKDPATQVMVSVDLGPELSGAAYEAAIEIQSAGSPPQTFREAVTRSDFPLCLAVVPKDGDAGRSFTVVVQLFEDGEVVSRHTVETGFVASEIRTLSITLEQCAAPGNCASPVIVPPALLGAFVPDRCEGGFDGDAGTADAGNLEVGLGDARTDVLVDASTPLECDLVSAEMCGYYNEATETTEFTEPPEALFIGADLFLFGITDPGTVAIHRYAAEENSRHVTFSATLLRFAGAASQGPSPCVGLSGPDGPQTIMAGAVSVYSGSSNHVLACAPTAVNPTAPFTISSTRPFAVGAQDEVRLAVFLDTDLHLGSVSGRTILGTAAGTPTNLRVTGLAATTCSSLSFDGRWTTYNMNNTAAAVYDAEGVDAFIGCTLNAGNPTRSFHLGGDGDETVQQLIMDGERTMAIVQHTGSLTLAVGQGDPIHLSFNPGTTIVVLGAADPDFRTFDGEASFAFVDGTQVIASVDEETTRVEWADRSRPPLLMPGAWALVAARLRDSTSVIAFVGYNGMGELTVRTIDSVRPD